MELTRHESLTQRVFRLDHRLETYRLFYQAGVTQAALDALFIFKGSIDLNTENVPVPQWLFKAMANLIGEFVPRPQIGKKGVNSKQSRDAIKRNAALVRYQAVMGARKTSKNLDEAYSEASDTLLGTPYYGDHEIIKRDFKEVQLALKSEKEIMKYYPLPGSLFESQD